MVIAIVLGVVIAIVGFLPYAFATTRARKMSSGDTMGHLKWLLVTFFISFAILVIALVVCTKVAHDVALAFAAAEILTFIVAIIALGLFGQKRK